MARDSVQHWNFALVVLNLQILLPKSQLITTTAFRKTGCECRRRIELAQYHVQLAGSDISSPIDTRSNLCTITEMYFLVICTLVSIYKIYINGKKVKT